MALKLNVIDDDLAFPKKSHLCPDLWIESLLFDSNYKFINGGFTFSPGYNRSIY